MNFETASQIAGVVSCLIAVIAFFSNRPIKPPKGTTPAQQTFSPIAPVPKLEKLQPTPEPLPDPPAASSVSALISEYVKSLIWQQGDLKPGYSTQEYVQFNPTAWGDSPLYQGKYPMCLWFLYFQFNHLPDGLFIELVMTPGTQEDRETLFQLAQTRGFPGCPPRLRTRGKWMRLFKKPILEATDYNKTQEQREAIISEKWTQFLHSDLPYITQAVRKEEWLWETASPSTPVPRPSQQMQNGQYIKSLVLNDQRFELYNFGRALSWINFTWHEWHKSLKVRDHRPPTYGHAVFPYLAFNNHATSNNTSPRLTVGMWDRAGRPSRP